MDTIPVSNEFIANEENSCKITAQSNVVENTSIELTTQTTKMDNSSKVILLSSYYPNLKREFKFFLNTFFIDCQ